MRESINSYIDPEIAQRRALHTSIVAGTDTEPTYGPTSELENFFKSLSPPLPILSWGINHIQRYLEEADGESHRMGVRKLIHTKNVMKRIYQIAEETGEDWNKPQILSIAFLHDICRLPQAYHYQTFKDADSFDHADMAAETVARARLPFAAVGCDESEVLNAIADHSQLKTPQGRYSLVLRDADKLVIAHEFMKDNEQLIHQGIEPQEIDADTLAQLLENKVVKHGPHIGRPVNRTLQRISWIHDLHFNATRTIASQEGIFDKLFLQLKQLTTDPRTEVVRAHLDQWNAQLHPVTFSLQS